MSRFASHQVRPFRFEVTESTSPMRVYASCGESGFDYEFSIPKWSFLFQQTGEPVPADPCEVDFWLEVLQYDEPADLNYVQLPGHPPFPREALEDWPRETEYEYDLWRRERVKYLLWKEQVRALEESLPPEHNWSEPPPEQQLRQLEFELSHAIPDRVRVLNRLHALGLLAPEDEGRRDQVLANLGCEKLRQWREASLLHRWVSRFIDGCWPEGAKSVLSSPVGLEWFLEGPYQQQHLDPLHHLKFALHEHLRREPPECSSSLVVSMGGRFSGAFTWTLGPGDIPQLVRGGEPPPHSPLYRYYQHKLTNDGDRIAELSARAIRGGHPQWGGQMSLAWLRQEPEHGQCWIELGVALECSGHPKLGKACLEKAQSLGFSFSTSGELSRLWAQDSIDIPPFEELGGYLPNWDRELKALTGEEFTAVVLLRQRCVARLIKSGLPVHDAPPALRRILEEPDS